MAKAITEEARVDSEVDHHHLSSAIVAGKVRDESMAKQKDAEVMAAVEIQKATRKWEAGRATHRKRLVRKYKERKEAAIKIQAVARAYLVKRRLKRRLMLLRGTNTSTSERATTPLLQH